MGKLFFAFCLVLVLKLGAQTSYLYSDGNSNSYAISETQIKFDPVSPEQSSSGMYSGGEPKVKVITPHEFRKLSVLFEEAFSDTTSQQKKREMGSGLLIWYTKTKVEKKVILKRNSNYALKVEDMLKELMK